MAYERLRNAALPQALTDIVGDVADLIQKELRLARAEITSKLAIKLQASIWIVTGAAFGILALMLLLQALVFGIASYGIALHWACLIVSTVLFVLAAVTFFKGRADAQGDLMPTQTIHQIRRDISVAKEQLT